STAHGFSCASGPLHFLSIPTSSLSHCPPIARNMDPDLTDFQRAIAADRETVARFLRDIPPSAEPVHDYITDLDERCALFGEVQQLHHDLKANAPNAATLGFFMV